MGSKPQSCVACVEKDRRLAEAVNLLRRGVKMLNRVGWEKGETDNEWREKAQSYLAAHDIDASYTRKRA